mmetsp:Transcript_40077/g.52503  ORF Transcript_40077/g.52503 Transcript_40077/m.52503 type:complete len:109 (-) Transcript_40077:253-579(-)|eukprot:CAMPEP_0185611876 /NCGR_PEP_ID=MMETSP0436-20130131/17860_1 /TAXON_ID=626734 ORGANISM="Favella taraikaensis, Strain Fe Narragansett Bay" /NCGR_SAMPLE_ID=MMETSP0436 /ASSEMBLY_ACC=CAM_ASM_000390 /LENGTH=108 /DNA_ID=CAMNT_0028244913 /DNA_START=124 /DNA_END=450 /DNA_ORIENTATION=-
MADCQFERRVCDIFAKQGTRMDYPALLLFKEGQIWMYAGQRQDVTKDTLLDYLSGDNFLEASMAFDSDMQGWLATTLGKSSTNRWLKKMMDSFESAAESWSKQLFKQL